MQYWRRSGLALSHQICNTPDLDVAGVRATNHERSKKLNAATHTGADTASAPRLKSGADKATVSALLKTILESLDDSKAEDVVPIDIQGKSTIGDHMIVASGRSHRHVGAVANYLLRDIKSAGFGPVKIEGMPSCDWVLIDAGDVIVHIFRPEVREFYNLEKMWQAADLGEDNLS